MHYAVGNGCRLVVLTFVCFDQSGLYFYSDEQPNVVLWSVVVKNGEWLMDWTSIPGRGQNFFFLILPDWLWGPLFCFSKASRLDLKPTHPSIKLLRRYWPLWEGDHSPPSSCEGRKEWSHTSTPPLRFQGLMLKYAQRCICLLFVIKINNKVLKFLAIEKIL